MGHHRQRNSVGKLWVSQGRSVSRALADRSAERDQRGDSEVSWTREVLDCGVHTGIESTSVPTNPSARRRQAWVLSRREQAAVRIQAVSGHSA